VQQLTQDLKKDKIKLNANLTKWKMYSKTISSDLITIDQIYIDGPNNSAFIASNIHDYVLLSVNWKDHH
jgi:hypothetical protein